VAAFSCQVDAKLVGVVFGWRWSQGDDDVERTDSAPRLLLTRRDTSAAAARDKMRFKASIQNITTFTSMTTPHAFIAHLLSEHRAHCIAQLARSARVGEAQRRASMLHHHPRAGHTGVGVSCLVVACMELL
jgi:hypothetical protein